MYKSDKLLLKANIVIETISSNNKFYFYFYSIRCENVDYQIAIAAKLIELSTSVLF